MLNNVATKINLKTFQYLCSNKVSESLLLCEIRSEIAKGTILLINKEIKCTI